MSSTYTVFVDFDFDLSLILNSSERGGISSNTFPFSSMPISANVRFARKLCVFFKDNNFSCNSRSLVSTNVFLAAVDQELHTPWP